jgi:peptidyl-tRNA hydrolase, PTH1 family
MLRALRRLFFGGRRGEDPAAAPTHHTDGADASREDTPVKVILCLGNPGKEYERTRHNVGWWVADHLAEVWRTDSWRRDGEARVAGGRVGNTPVRLVKPQTYMNLSGAVLKPYQRKSGWSPQHDLLVVVDEVALPIGRFRLRAGGSAGGHNGLKSIEAALGHQDYARLRIGIAPEDPRRRGDLSDFVLGDFGKADGAVVRDLLPTLTELVQLWVRDGAEAAMSKFNRIGNAGVE